MLKISTIAVLLRKTDQTFTFLDFFQNKMSPESTSFFFSAAKVLSVSHQLPVTMMAEKNGLLFDAELNLQRFSELRLENYYSDSVCVRLLVIFSIDSKQDFL